MQGTVIGLLFLGLSIVVHMANVQNLAVSFVLGLMACTAVNSFSGNIRRKIWESYGIFCKVHYANFPDAHVICGTDEICSAEDRCYECSNSYCTRTWNQFCRTDCSCVDYEENKMVRVLSVSE